MATASKPEKPATPIAEIEDLRTQLATANSDLGIARQSLSDITTRFQKSESDLTARTDELVTERRLHSEAKLKLQTAETDLAAEKSAHETLKTDTQANIDKKAAEIAAGNGHAAAPAAPAAAPGALAEEVDKTKLTGVELLAMSLKNDTQHQR
jgi:chromosome segregation ATPase